MKIKQHFDKEELQYLNLVLLEAKSVVRKKELKKIKAPPRTMEMRKYNNKRTTVGYQYYKPISKILAFNDE